MKSNNNNILYYPITFFLSIYVLSCVSSLFSFGISRAIQVVTIVFLFFYIVRFIKGSDYISKIGAGVVLFSFYVFFYRLIDYSKAGWGNVFMQICFYISIVAPIFYIKKINQRQGIIVYYIIASILLIVLIRDILLISFYGVYNYSFVDLSEMGSNVSLTAFSSMILVLYCVSLLVFLNSHKITIKVFHAIVLSFSFYYIVFCSMRGSIVLLMFLATILLLYEKFSNISQLFKIISIILILFLGVGLFLDMDTVFSFLVNISPNDRLTYRIYDLQSVYSEGLSDSSFSGRYALERLSLSTWLQNPLTFLFGIGDHRISEFGVEGFIKTGIGGHSEIIDSLARFGIIGFSIIAILFYRISLFILALFDEIQIKKQVKMILIVFILTAFTKAVMFHLIGLAIFILFPMSSFVINFKK